MEPPVDECPICLIPYTLEGRTRPAVGICGHTVCYACAQKLRGGSCPTCQEKGAFDRLSINYDMIGVLKELKAVKRRLEDALFEPEVLLHMHAGKQLFPRPTTPQPSTSRATRTPPPAVPLHPRPPPGAGQQQPTVPALALVPFFNQPGAAQQPTVPALALVPFFNRPGAAQQLMVPALALPAFINQPRLHPNGGQVVPPPPPPP